MHTKNAEFKAGITILLALAALLGFLFLAGGSELPWAKHRLVWLRFAQGYTAPLVGDPVLMNGVKIGVVKTVEQQEETRRDAQLTIHDRAHLKIKPNEPGVAREIYVLASVRMGNAQKLPKGTSGTISETVTGGRKLQLEPGLSVANLTDEDTSKSPILVTPTGDLTEVVKAVEALVKKFESVGENVNLVLGDARGLVADVRKKIETIDLQGIQGNVLEASAALKETLRSLQGRVEEIANKVSDAATNLKTLTQHGDEVVTAAGADVKEILADIKALSADLKAIVARAGPKVDQILDEVTGAAQKANLAVGEFQGLGTKVGGVVDGAGHDLGKALDQVTQAGHNIADITEDLKSHPWKLANRPEDKEIAFENLRNAAANYVRASEAIQETLGDIKALGGRADITGDERKRLLDALFARLQSDMNKYDEAAKLFTRFLQQGGAQPPR